MTRIFLPPSLSRERRGRRWIKRKSRYRSPSFLQKKTFISPPPPSFLSSPYSFTSNNFQNMPHTFFSQEELKLLRKRSIFLKKKSFFYFKKTYRNMREASSTEEEQLSSPAAAAVRVLAAIWKLPYCYTFFLPCTNTPSSSSSSFSACKALLCRLSLLLLIQRMCVCTCMCSTPCLIFFNIYRIQT